MDEATRNQALDVVLAIVAVSALVIGLVSMLIGKIADWRGARSVNYSRPVMSPSSPALDADKQTDDADRPQTADVSAHNQFWDEFLLDRTRTRLITVMVDSGMTVGEIRALLKGDNGAIGTEVEAARKRLGIDPPERTLKVRDEQGERVIAF